MNATIQIIFYIDSQSSKRPPNKPNTLIYPIYISINTHIPPPMLVDLPVFHILMTVFHAMMDIITRIMY